MGVAGVDEWESRAIVVQTNDQPWRAIACRFCRATTRNEFIMDYVPRVIQRQLSGYRVSRCDSVGRPYGFTGQYFFLGVALTSFHRTSRPSSVFDVPLRLKVFLAASRFTMALPSA
jgi:hypothetical protein